MPSKPLMTSVSLATLVTAFLFNTGSASAQAVTCSLANCQFSSNSDWTPVPPYGGAYAVLEGAGSAPTAMVDIDTDLNGLTVRAPAMTIGEQYNIMGNGSRLDLRELNIENDTDIDASVDLNFYSFGKIEVSDNVSLKLFGDVKVDGGTGGIEKSGDGSLGIIRNFAGSLSIQGGLVSLAADSTQFTGNLNVGMGTQLYLNVANRSIGSLSGQGQVRVFGNSHVEVGGDNSFATLHGIVTSSLNSNTQFAKVGTGMWEIASSAVIDASLDVRSGEVLLDGTIDRGVAVNGGVLSGRGKMAELDVITGTLSPGSPFIGTGTLEVTGFATLGSSSVFEVSVDDQGHSSMLLADSVALDGGILRVAPIAGSYASSSSYTIIKTTSGISGNFGTFKVADTLAFLSPSVQSDGRDMTMTLERRNAGGGHGGNQGGLFETAAISPNQASSAGAIEQLGAGNKIYDTVMVQTPEGAQQAFNSLSGDIHASQNASFVQSSLVMRNAALARAGLGSSAAFSSSALTAYAVTGASRDAATTNADGRAWGGVYGSRAWLDDDGNAGSMNSRSGGIQAGVDDWFGDMRLGLMFSLGRTQFEASSRGSSADSTDYGLGAYGGREFGSTLVSLGASYQRHEIDSRRTVAFPGFEESLSASYSGGTAQAFGELGHRISLPLVTLQPYAQAAYVYNHTDDFTETGGLSALTVSSDDQSNVFTTLGVRGGSELIVGDRSVLTATAGLGWRHAFGEDPSSVNSFGNGASFTVSGTPITKNALVVEAGLDFAVSDRVDVSLAYEGQIAKDAQDHGATAGLRLKF